jgi:hypothetical protein
MNHELRIVQLWKELLHFIQDCQQQLEESATSDITTTPTPTPNTNTNTNTNIGWTETKL